MTAEVGKRAPTFTLNDQNGEKVALKDLFSDYDMIVLTCYPRAMTPGCTTQSKDFTALKPEFDKLKVKILGISTDSCAKQKKFETKEALGITLLSDENHKVLEKYGFWGEKKLYGKTHMGTIRSSAVIGSNGKILMLWNKVRAKGHAKKVLNWVQSSSGADGGRI